MEGETDVFEQKSISLLEFSCWVLRWVIVCIVGPSYFCILIFVQVCSDDMRKFLILPFNDCIGICGNYFRFVFESSKVNRLLWLVVVNDEAGLQGGCCRRIGW